MFKYDDGEIYNCPFDVANAKQADALKDLEYNNKGEIVQVHHGEGEDYFYDPMHCNLFYKDPFAPIWFGRVEDLTPMN